MQVDLQKSEPAWRHCCEHYALTCILLACTIVPSPVQSLTTLRLQVQAVS